MVAFASDRMGRRLPFAILAGIIAIVGLAMVLAGGKNYDLKYGGCFLIAMGLYTCMPVLVCWMSLNFSGHTRKSVGTAFVIGFGNIGGIISSYIFPNTDAPDYKKGLGICIAFTAMAIIFITLYFLRLCQMNRKKQKIEYQDKWASRTPREKIMDGDLNPDFRYLY
ncbi:unnamed protein product [Ambrosiozyma monospora]|uniref:Unnamed protein product n=1 Tax=Ambrosiozyma monospora TaxID=43982 RepID=A0ACB5T7H6_AMBMO|nr:unnamed protein product [Ambrosiozyma monospora]